MSHFTVLVTSPDVDTALAPFNEQLETPRIITREELIASSKKDVEDYKNGIYATYLADPEAYLKDCTNEGHKKYLQEGFPKKLEWTDEEHYQDALQWYDEDQRNADGSVNTTYNKDGKWDWYQVGGRWGGALICKPEARDQYPAIEFSLGWSEADKAKVNPNSTDVCHIKNLDWDAMREEQKQNAIETYNKVIDPVKSQTMWMKKDEVEFIKSHTVEEYIALKQKSCPFATFAVLMDGVWYERGKMGWFGISRDEDADWDAKFQELIEPLDPETLLTVVDCHV